jgi:hypothetical protein
MIGKDIPMMILKSLKEESFEALILKCLKLGPMLSALAMNSTFEGLGIMSDILLTLSKTRCLSGEGLLVMMELTLEMSRVGILKMYLKLARIVFVKR